MIQDVDKLVISQACSQQILRFAALNDANDHDGLAKLFTERGEFARPSAPDEIIVGRDAILEAFKKRPRRKSLHLVSNVIIDVLGATEAVADSLVTLYSAQEGAEVAQPPYLLGRFLDRLVLVEGQWVFASRRGRIEFKVQP